MTAQLDRKQLGELWEEATTLPDADTSPLAKAIIHEALEGGGDGETCEAEAAAKALYAIARDVEDFANAIVCTARGQSNEQERAR